MSSTVKILGMLLAGALFFSGTAKLTSPHHPSYMLGPVAHYGAAVIEVLLAFLVASRFFRIVCHLTVLLAVGGVVVAWLREGRPCGCLGSIYLDWQDHLLLAAGFGLCAAAALLASDRVRRGDAESSAIAS